MKVSDWRRKLAASLVASGVMVPAVAKAAPVDANLLLNPGFENVDLNTVGFYNAPLILNWGNATPAFAYSHNGSTAGNPPEIVPNYANGAALAGGGNWYFGSNNGDSGDGDIDTIEEAMSQTIDLSTGPTGALISGGGAAFNLGAFFNTYDTNNDGGIVQVDFFNGASVNLGTTMVRPPDPGNLLEWTQLSAGGPVPAGTATARVSVYAFANNAGADGYIDNVDFRLTEASGILLFLEVNTATGQTTLKNQTGEPVNIDYYEVTSGVDGAGDSLNVTAWNSLQEQNVAGFPPGDGSGNGWEQFGGADAGTIGESYLSGASAVNDGASISLGAAFQPGDPQDLTFRYAVAPVAALASDFDGDADVDGADFLAWQRGLGTASGATKAQGNADGDGDVDAADLAVWKSDFGASGGGAGGPSVLVSGFVRYVTGSAAAVPEPSTLLIAAFGVLPLFSSRRR